MRIFSEGKKLMLKINMLYTTYTVHTHTHTHTHTHIYIYIAIPITGRGGPQGCETSRLPHFLDSRLTNGSEVVSLTSRPTALYPKEDSWYLFLLEAKSTTGP
jgi:hypothetical protein